MKAAVGLKHFTAVPSAAYAVMRCLSVHHVLVLYHCQTFHPRLVDPIFHLSRK